jgi:hypothetical protein
VKRSFLSTILAFVWFFSLPVRRGRHSSGTLSMVITLTTSAGMLRITIDLLLKNKSMSLAYSRFI